MRLKSVWSRFSNQASAKGARRAQVVGVVVVVMAVVMLWLWLVQVLRYMNARYGCGNTYV